MIDKLKTLYTELTYQRNEFLNSPDKIKTVGCAGMVREYDKMLNIVRELIKEHLQTELKPEKPYTTLDVMYISGVREVVMKRTLDPFGESIKSVLSLNGVNDTSDFMFNKLTIRNGHATNEGAWRTAEEFYE